MTSEAQTRPIPVTTGEGSPWPTSQQGLLLDAILEAEERAVQDLEEWKSVSDIDYLDRGSYRLLPQLYDRLRRRNVADPMMPKLRGVYRREWYQN